MSITYLHIVCPHVFPGIRGRTTQHRGFTGIYGVECAHHCRTRDNEMTMQDICEVNAISLFGVNVTKDDVNVIADTLSDIVKNWDSADVKKYLCVHWKNMVGCINVASESDRNFMRSRSDIFEEAENRNLVKSFPDKGELITTWSRRLAVSYTHLTLPTI